MTSSDPTDRPAPVEAFRAFATRLAAVDLWDQAALLRSSALDDAAPAQERLETAWCHLRSGNFTAAREVLARLPEQFAPASGMRLALDAIGGDVIAYHRLVAEASGPDAGPIPLRLVLVAATTRGDLPTAARAAKAMLVHLPADAEAWIVVAAEKATVGNMAAALAATERARADRVDCQSDPAGLVLDLLDHVAHPEAATELACHGAVAEKATRPGWPGWRALLTDRVPSRFSLTDGPYALVAALAAAASGVALVAGEPAALGVHAALAAGAVAVIRSRTVDGLDAALTRLVRSALSRRSPLTPTLWARARARFDPFVYERPVVAPAECSCWETDLFSGPFWEGYLAEHLTRSWADEPTGLVFATCPDSGKQWLHLPHAGVAVVAPDRDGEDEPTGPGAAGAQAADAVKVGQYL